MSATAPTAAGWLRSLTIEYGQRFLNDIPRAQCMKDPKTFFRAPEAPPQGRVDLEYEEFLYAQLGEEANGMQLSVLSALARQNMDPWEIAQRLSSLPREQALPLLTPLLACIPSGAEGLNAPEDIAARLIALLPSSRAAARNPGASGPRPASATPVPNIEKLRLIVAFALLLLMSQWLITGWLSKPKNETPLSPAAAAVAPAGDPSAAVY
jgi:hypothetical protein